MSQSKMLGALASQLCEALPKTATDIRLYISDLGMYHYGDATAQLEYAKAGIRARPSPMPFYGKAFAAALEAVERGWEARAAYHSEFLAKAVKRAGGVLVEVKRIERVIGNIPQPTDRRSGDTARVPRTGKE